MIITEKTPHVNTYRKDTWTHDKGKTHPKGMKTHQKGNTIERILSFIFIGFLTCGDFAQNQDREHMSSAQIDVAKRKLDTHDNHRKNTAREHISKRHMNTQQRENTSKRHENTPKGKHNWKNFVFHPPKPTSCQTLEKSIFQYFSNQNLNRKKHSPKPRSCQKLKKSIIQYCY